MSSIVAECGMCCCQAAIAPLCAKGCEKLCPEWVPLGTAIAMISITLIVVGILGACSVVSLNFASAPYVFLSIGIIIGLLDIAMISFLRGDCPGQD